MWTPDSIDPRPIDLDISHPEQLPDVEVHSNMPFGHSFPVLALGLPEVRRVFEEWWRPDPQTLPGGEAGEREKARRKAWEEERQRPVPPGWKRLEDGEVSRSDLAEGEEQSLEEEVAEYQRQDEEFAELEAMGELADLIDADQGISNPAPEKPQLIEHWSRLYNLLYSVSPHGFTRIFAREHQSVPILVRVLLNYPLHRIWGATVQIDAAKFGAVFAIAYDMYSRIYVLDDGEWLKAGHESAPRAHPMMANRQRGEHVWGHDLCDLSFEGLLFSPAPGVELLSSDDPPKDPLFVGTVAFEIGS